MSLVTGFSLLTAGCGSDPIGPANQGPDPVVVEGPFEGLFIAAGDGRLLFSRDGLSWSDVEEYGEAPFSLAGRRVVDIATTRNQIVLTDTNQGQISRFLADPDRVDINLLAEPILTVATDEEAFLGFGRFGIYESTDGLAFTQIASNLAFPVGGLELNPFLVHGRDRYVGILSFRDTLFRFRFGIVTSPDGVTWEASNLWANLGFHVDLIHDAGGFLALGTRGVPDSAKRVVWLSPDGGTWIERDFANQQGPTPRTLARSESGRIVVLGSSPTGIYRWHSDDDGVTWSQGLAVGGETDAPLDMVYAQGRFFAVLESGRIATSTTGEEWTSLDPGGLPGGALRSVRYVE